MKKYLLQKETLSGRGSGVWTTMKKMLPKLLLSLAGTLGVTAAQAQDANFGWVNSFGGNATNSDFANGTVSDAAGNTYTIGNFWGTVNFGGIMLTSALTAAGTASTQDIYLVKTDPLGSVIWAKQIGGNSTDQGNSIAIDASGNLYITGAYTGIVDFGGTVATSIMSSASSYSTDIYVAKYDSNGSLLWVNSMGGTGTEYGQYIAVNGQDGSIYYAGALFSMPPVDMDPSATGTFTVSAPNTTGDIFISKQNNNGQFQWAKSFGSTASDLPYGITTDPSGNVILSGTFSLTITLDGVTLSTGSASSPTDGFVTQISSTGTVNWAKKAGSPIGSDNCRNVAVDASGNIFVTGSISNPTGAPPTDFSGNTLSGLFGGSDIFITKLQNNGTQVWFKLIGSTSTDNGWGIATDASGNVFASGLFSGTVTFDATGPTTLSSAGNADVFVARFGNDGTFAWAKSMGGPNNETNTDINVDATGNITVTGGYSGTANFGTAATPQNATSNGNYDGYLLQLVPNIPTPLRLTQFTASPKETQVLLGWTTATEQNVAGFAAERSTDGRSWKQIGFTASKATNSNTELHYAFYDRTPERGTNFYRLKSCDLDGTYTYSDIRSVLFGDSDAAVTAYPNPAASMLYIRVAATTASFTITDVMGKVVLQRNNLNGNNEVNEVSLQHLAPGTYWLNVHTASSVKTIRISKYQ